MKMESKKLLVTVGTTNFEKLIETVTQEECLNKLENLGFSILYIQTGSTVHEKTIHKSIKIIYTSFIDDFTSAIKEADLIISHAGAGTCLEVLKEDKPLIVVINEDLMDNHQLELAEQLQKDGCVYSCTCTNLIDVLSKDPNQLRKYPKPNPELFCSYLDKCMGFI